MSLHSSFSTGQRSVHNRLLLVARMIDRDIARDLQSEFNLTVAEWRVLAFICTTGSSIAAEICAGFDSDRAEVSRAVARLQTAGLVKRGPGEHHRSLTIMPTEAGSEMFERSQAMRDAYFSGITQDLSLEERQRIDDALESIALRLGEQRNRRTERPKRN